MVFHPLHMTPLLITEKTRRCQIVQRSTLGAYLPPQFRKSAREEKKFLNDKSSSNAISRTEFLSALQECIEFAVEPIVNAKERALIV